MAALSIVEKSGQYVRNPHINQSFKTFMTVVGAMLMRATITTPVDDDVASLTELPETRLGETQFLTAQLSVRKQRFFSSKKCTSEADIEPRSGIPPKDAVSTIGVISVDGFLF